MKFHSDVAFEMATFQVNPGQSRELGSDDGSLWSYGIVISDILSLSYRSDVRFFFATVLAHAFRFSGRKCRARDKRFKFNSPPSSGGANVVFTRLFFTFSAFTVRGVQSDLQTFSNDRRKIPEKLCLLSPVSTFRSHFYRVSVFATRAAQYEFKRKFKHSLGNERDGVDVDTERQQVYRFIALTMLLCRYATSRETRTRNEF